MAGRAVAAPARERMLDAAVALYDELPLASLMRGINPGSVAARAGASRTSFYACWETPEQFWADFTRHVSAAPAALAATEWAGREQQPVADNVRYASRRSFETWMQAGELRAQIMLWSKSNDPAIATLVRRRYEATIELLLPRWDSTLASWGLEIRPPFTTRDLVTVTVALADGLMIRHQFDPVAAPAGLFEDTLGILLPTLTRPIDEPGNPSGARAWVPDLESWPPPRRRSAAPAASERRARTRARLLEAFEEVVRERGYRATRTADVAERAGVSPSTLRDHFGSRIGLLQARMTEVTFALVARIEALDQGSTIETWLMMLYEYVSERRELFFAARLVAFEQPESGRPVGVRSPVVQALAAKLEPKLGPGVDRFTVASVWWRAVSLAAMYADMPSPPWEVVSLLVRGAPRLGTGRRAVSRPAPAAAGPT